MNISQVRHTIEKKLTETNRKYLPVEDAIQEAASSLQQDERFQQFFRTNNLKEEFDRIFQQGFVSDSYIEKIPQYQQGEGTSLQEMSDSGLISPYTAELFATYFGTDTSARLYRHQKDAAAAVSQNKNILVCSGTGSGKTESFLLPLFDALIKEREQLEREGKAYEKGVRAMILYPMNALVNDQVRRIRKILKGAERKGIKYAEDISFGTYTGDVATIAQERPLRGETTELSHAIKEGQQHVAETLHHPYLTDEVPAKHELVKRSTWNQEPGDILITNFSMLERLMLDPDMNNIFSPTWRFIILDEAHTYDGAVGTEIAWLIRRVVKRTHSRQMKYMATSATLVPTDGSVQGNLNAAKVIKEEFAARIFPAAADSFEVMFGEERVSVPPSDGASRTDERYREIANAEVVRNGTVWQHPVLSEESRSRFALIPAGFDKMKLLELTRWLNSRTGDSEHFAYLEKHYQQSRPAFGDAVAMARLVAELRPGAKLGLKPTAGKSSLRSFYTLLTETKTTQQDALQKMIGCRLTSKAAEVAEKIHNFLTRDDALEAEYFEIVAECILETAADLKRQPDPLRWMVEWTEESLSVLKECAEYCNAWRAFMKELQQDLLNCWKDVCGDRESDSIAACITTYLLQRIHSYRLDTFITEMKKTPKKCRWTEAKQAVFPDEPDAENKLDALVQLLGLSRHQGKPLMDLRFHQTISGISCLAVWFDDELAPHLLRDQEALTTLCGEEEKRLYTLGLCRKCGHPYLLAYSDAPDRDAFTVIRYPDERYRSLVAFSWVPTQNHAKATHYLDTKQGIISKEASTDSLPLYLVTTARQDDAQQGVSSRINHCDVCESRYDARGDFAQITPYQNGDELRCAALESIVHLVDPDYSAVNARSDGRKVLTFSDSRDAAARMVVRYEEYNSENILKELILNYLDTCDQRQLTDDDLEYLYQEFPGARYSQKRIMFKDNEKSDLEYAEDDEDREGISISYRKKISKYNNKFRENSAHTLAAILPNAIRKLRAIGADLLIEREYPETLNQQTAYKPFSDGASAAISLLSVLRSTKRHSLLREGLITVKSAHCSDVEKDSWAPLLNVFNSDNEKLMRFLQEWYRFLFDNCIALAANGSVDGGNEIFDEVHGKYYDSGENNLYALNGGDKHSKRPLVFNDRDNNTDYVNLKKLYPNSKLKTLVKSFLPNISKADLEQLAKHLYTALGENKVIIRSPHTNEEIYGLNLEDLRFSITDEGRKFLQGQRELWQDEKKLSIRIEEHTAQLSSYKGKLYQTEFSQGKINILSCSTTFEMGVDLGGLNCVFMANMPPAVSNYRQRAGRAGRRAGASSFVFTYIGHSSHDRNFKEHPDKLFFAQVKKPQIYLDNPVFRARHMRAEALHIFLDWCVKTYDANWKLCGDFFGLIAGNAGETPRSVISYLPEWAAAYHEDVQRYCEQILNIGKEHEPTVLNYNVAADLCWQILEDGESEHLKKLYAKGLKPDAPDADYFFRLLAGPHLPEYRVTRSFWVAAISKRIRDRYEFSDYNGKSHIRTAQTIDELAHSQILPMYGFPSDVAELKPEGSHNKNSAALKRDLKIAIFDYAPKQKVIADKRCFTSIEAKQYKFPGQQETNEEIGKEIVCHCPHCGQFYVPTPGKKEEADFCVNCNERLHPNNRHDAMIPDVFSADSGTKASSNDYSRPLYRQRFYAGENIDNNHVMPITGTQLEAYNSRRREIIYLNNHDKDNIWLMHRVRADVILWRLKNADGIPQGWSHERLQDAWTSALQAVLRATAEVLDINRKDVGGVITMRNGRHFMVLFDDSSSGSGALLNIMKIENGARDLNRQADENIRNILVRALNICESCDCYQGESGAATPHTTHDYLVKKQEGQEVREFRSCYSCLRSYTNQKEHAHLDAHDAAVILRAMLGDEGECTTTEAQTQLAESTQESKEQQREQIQKDGTACPLGKAQHIESSTIPFLKKFRVWNGSEVIEMEWLQKSAGCDNCADMIKVSDKTLTRNVPFANIYPL